MRLNLGCGKDIKKDYHNIDIRPLDGVIQADVCALPYKDGTVDEIIASDVYEHISHLKSQELLKHWVSLLKDGGVLIIRCPCLDSIIQYFASAINLFDVETGIAAVFGGQDYPENTHLTICQVALMQEYLTKAGIKNEMKYCFEGTNVVWRCIK